MKSPADSPSVRNAASRYLAPDAQAATSGSAVSICLIGGKTIFRSAIHKLLESPDISVARAFDDEKAFAKAARAGQADGLDLILFISGGGSFASFNRLRDLLAPDQPPPPVVVLGEQFSQGGLHLIPRISMITFLYLRYSGAGTDSAVVRIIRNCTSAAPHAKNYRCGHYRT